MQEMHSFVSRVTVLVSTIHVEFHLEWPQTLSCLVILNHLALPYFMLPYTDVLTLPCLVFVYHALPLFPYLIN